MSEFNMLSTRIILCHGTSAEWALSSKVLMKGEPAISFLDNRKIIFKIGNGVDSFDMLPSVFGDVKSFNVTLQENETVQQAIARITTNESFSSSSIVNVQGKGSYIYNGTEWIEIPSSDSISTIENSVSELEEKVQSLQEVVSSESIAEKVNDAVSKGINEFAEKISDNGTVDTFKELVDYVAEHGSETAKIIKDVSDLHTAIDEQNERSNKVFNRVRYEISNKPDGAIVNYQEKEIRILIPSNTSFSVQEVGANGDPSKYYIGFRAYAPNEDVTSFKETVADSITDDTMYYFENNEFAGIDEYGRRYSVVWLPVASLDSESGSWTYFGKNSSTKKYVGWYYSVEWYNASGTKVASDCIRINLSNENCHNSAIPYYANGFIKGIKVNDAEIEVVDGIANISLSSSTNLKASDEVTIAEDGTLGIGSVDVAKLVQNENVMLILNGGSTI